MKFNLFNCKGFRKKKHVPQGGAILDQVISESCSPNNKVLLYKLANYKLGGDLIDAFNIGGQHAVEELIREQFGVFMYKGGKGQIINRAEYLRWKYMENAEVSIPIEASLSSHDPLGKWTDHKACWQMQYRGALGESLLHVLILCDTKVHTKLARLLIRVFPELALDVMEGEEYLGASALHLAIAYSNNELVNDLIDAGADVHQRAIGRFFLPKDQQSNTPVKNTDYEGLAYLGEYPLAWAACVNNESVYNLLLEVGADPDAQDSFGNMILHMVVVGDKLDMFGYALRHPKLPAKNGIVNKAGLTPLTLACKLGRSEVFREMLELSCREFWRYSNITCSAYPLNALDTLMPDGSTNWNAALIIILNGTKPEHLDMLDGGIIERLLEEKWKTFAQHQFLKRLLILFIHLFFMSISVYTRPSRTKQSHKDDDDDDDDDVSGDDELASEALVMEEGLDVQTIIRYCCECATIAGVISFVVFQQGDELKNQGLKAFLKQLKQAPAKAIFLVSNLLILSCIPCRIMGDDILEDRLLCFAVPGSWFLLMFFAGAIRLTGPFVTMIYSMITGDMFTFSIIYIIVLFGFSQAYFFLYKGHENVDETPYGTYASTWMGNTYAYVIEQSEKEFMKQWAKIVVTLERAIPQTDAQKYLEEYSIGLGPSDDPRFEQRGVMVIKSKSKTRAKQRKGAVSNWKWVLKTTLGELKKRGMTGEEMRRLMWGRASITSPKKVSKKKKHIEEEDPFGLTAALDQMSFAQDIVMIESDPTRNTTVVQMTSTSTTTPITVEPQQTPPPDYSTVTDIVTSEPSSVTQPPTSDKVQIKTTGKATPSSTTQSKAPTATTTPAKGIPEKTFNDPLRDLILLSEVILIDDEVEFLRNVKSLAEDSSCLDYVLEVKSTDLYNQLQQQRKQDLMKSNTLEQGISLFQNPKEIVDPVKEAEFLKTLEALDDTDDSDAVEKPVLGKISLVRRAKSAATRTSATDKRKSDEHPLCNLAWEDIENGDENSIINWIYDGDRLKTGDDDDEIVTVEDVKRKMEMLHLNRKSSADSESTSEHARSKKKYKKVYRTGRNNKVSPEESKDDDSSKQRRGKSAPIASIEISRHIKEKVAVDGGVQSPPDPLEPWSTKNIKSINNILDSSDRE
ncbi:CLUMA_CG002996, isoform A [Clunio marinus]|uniref:CLUMA_CG002996, isoform A n=1 Tax=Clunio marinus TaxID=568069 RepID=A0A1J1HMG2_9DIPT|nr:CLUMA_CG002996, isoform A [Clunio marinus]